MPDDLFKICTLSGASEERSGNVAYWPKAESGGAVGPDVIAGQGDVCEEIVVPPMR